jgi:L-fuconolactonase
MRDLLDAHVHLWDTTRRELPWLPAGHPLRRDFTIADLEADAGVLPSVVVVQADADPLEVHDLLDLAASTPSVAGVVGWFDLLADDVAVRIDAAVRHADQVGARLVGVRCPPADQHDPAALTAMSAGVRAATEAGLAIDLLVRPAALPGVAELADSVPAARLVLDHLGNPREEDSDWSCGMKLLADRPGVTVKLSGLTAISTDPEMIAAHVGEVAALFGADRLMYGSDWPVCTLTTDYRSTLDLVLDLLPRNVQAAVLGTVARRIYRLP